jgi:RNA 2',3'-cyclic 3'-phosphodiesterase
MTAHRLPPANWFIALAVPTASWWHRISPPPEGVRLLAPEDVHLTVAFLGSCGRAAAEAAFELAPQWPARSFDVELGHVAAMGNPRRPSALSAIVARGADELGAAILTVRDAMCERAGARLEDRAPLPHVTIARPRRNGSRSELKAAISWATSVDLAHPRVSLSRLVLFTRADDRRERLFREHSVYDVLEDS